MGVVEKSLRHLLRRRQLLFFAPQPPAKAPSPGGPLCSFCGGHNSFNRIVDAYQWRRLLADEAARGRRAALCGMLAAGAEGENGHVFTRPWFLKVGERPDVQPGGGWGLPGLPVFA